MKNQSKNEYMSNYQDFTAEENPRALGDLMDHSAVRRGKTVRVSGDSDVVRLALEHAAVCLSVGAPWLGLASVRSRVLVVGPDRKKLREDLTEAAHKIEQTREFPGAYSPADAHKLTPQAGSLLIGQATSWSEVEKALADAGGSRVVDCIILSGLDSKEIKLAGQWCKSNSVALVADSGFCDATVKLRSRTDGLLDVTISAGVTPVAFCARCTSSDIYRDEPEQ